MAARVSRTKEWSQGSPEYDLSDKSTRSDASTGSGPLSTLEVAIRKSSAGSGPPTGANDGAQLTYPHAELHGYRQNEFVPWQLGALI